jgi:membrane-bound inhibitor of C-type lysozyme
MKMKNIEWRHVTWYSQLFAIVLFLDVFGLGFWLGLQQEGVNITSEYAAMQQYDAHAQMMQPTATKAAPVMTSVKYLCSGNKTIEAVFSGNTVNLSLSDGRSENLLQAISADGGRYTNSDESFVFWSVGKGATITESGKTTYTGCETTTKAA